MFNTSKYTKYYFNIVSRAKARVPVIGTYYEKHHIIPKSLGGGNGKDNIVSLTAKEHAICHLCLVRMTEGMNKSKMACAAWRMMFAGNTHTRYKITSKMYEAVRIEMAKAASTRSKAYRHTEERKQKIADSKKGKKRTIGSEWRAKIIASQTGIKKPSCSDERKRKISVALTGVKTGPQSEEHKRKVSESKKGKKLFVDPVTGKRYMAYPHQALE